MAKAKTKSKDRRHIRQYEEMLASPAYRDLRPAARCLLIEFQRICVPWNNGRLSISTRRAADIINVSEPTASKAFYELAEHGFLKPMKGELWMESKAREWRLTFETYDNNREPTDDWQGWEPNKTVFAAHRKKPTKKTGVDRSKIDGTVPKKRGRKPSDSILDEIARLEESDT